MTQCQPRVRVAPDIRLKVSPLASRIAAIKNLDLTGVRGSGPNGRIVRRDVLASLQRLAASSAAIASPSPPAAAPVFEAVGRAQSIPITPHEVVKLSGMRKTIGRRLTISKQQVPHIDLTVDIRLDALLNLRGELNATLQSRKVKLSVNDLLIKALGVSLVQVPECNVQFAGDTMLQFARADISVAVSIPGGLITPIVASADSKGVAAISNEIRDLATRAKNGNLAPQEYQGGTATLSNMGMFGIKQFEAVINPPQAMIMAIGAGERRPYVVDDALEVTTVMSATGSFDHRVIDGTDGAWLMAAFKELVENPLSLLA
ncbi:Acetyltransferase component of pyruvate dehydrogenase complex [Sphingobium herbicidovorans NBRC 16415]|uniref:Acetyltransferase component of pyruvate dehydrogenase complex n=1 Tax=Sphingobium herbicidovorans (strain ATCC 700291 / DSM 11019 / CCUG 56400 / KCTC 2939 / LMG 18315 / NBRC 16415 / MH) TaxID=1219045 RepID=A0A086PBR3_SPHHM|nr:Acetyltransferase component of pyruvate dehydrogenase complex [Sphingobium herbicidovorans NBRC 16415]